MADGLLRPVRHAARRTCSGCCYLPLATPPPSAAPTDATPRPVPSPGGGGSGGRPLPPACWPPGSPKGSRCRRGAMHGLPGITTRRPRSVAGEGRAFGACCFAGKLRSPAGPAPVRLGQGGLIPAPIPVSTPAPIPAQASGAPHPSLLTASVQLKTPLGGAVRFARLIHPARPRSWRTCGPRRLRRQSQPVLVATQGGTA